MTSNIIVLPSYHGVSAQAYAAVSDLLIKANAKGLSTVIIDLSPYDNYDDVNLRFAASRRLAYPIIWQARRTFFKHAKTLGAQIICLKAFGGQDINPYHGELSTCTSASDLLQIRNDDGLLGSSLYSWLTTYKARDFNPDLAHFKDDLHKQAVFYFSVKELVSETIKRANKVGQVFVWNGRFPAWAGAVSAAKDSDCQVIFFENGIGNAPRYTCSEISTHDVERNQELNVHNHAGITNTELEDLRQYLIERKTNSRANAFIEGMLYSDEAPNNIKRGVSIFTSSNDEIADLGLIGKSDTWESQEEGIAAACSFLHSFNIPVTVRIHPNLVTKSWNEYRRVKEFARSLPAKVIGPTSSISSYQLLDNSAYVIVWASTIGAEAIYMGIPTFLLGDSQYSKMSAVTQVTGPRYLDRLNHPPNIVDRDSVLPYLSTLWRDGIPVTEPVSLRLWNKLRIYDKFFSGLFRLSIILDLANPWASPRNFLLLSSCVVGRRRARLLLDKSWH